MDGLASATLFPIGNQDAEKPQLSSGATAQGEAFRAVLKPTGETGGGPPAGPNPPAQSDATRLPTKQPDSVDSAAATTAPEASPTAADRLKAVLAASMRAEARLDGLLKEATAGKAFSPQALIALQADVYRHAQAIEVISRGTGQLVSGLKQILNTQA